MKNAHLRFGWLTYVKSTEKTTTSIKLRLDRFIGEALPDPPRQAKAHLISVIGGDTQVAAASAAISLGDRFIVEGPGVQPIRVCLERNAQCFKGSVQLAGRKKPLRHLVGLSEEFASSNISADSGRTLLASSENGFVWASLAHIHGIPGMPKWGDWFAGELGTHRALIHALGIGCDPGLSRARKNSFSTGSAGALRVGQSSSQRKRVRFIGRPWVWKTFYSEAIRFKRARWFEKMKVAGTTTMKRHSSMPIDAQAEFPTSELPTVREQSRVADRINASTAATSGGSAL